MAIIEKILETKYLGYNPEFSEYYTEVKVLYADNSVDTLYQSTTIQRSQNPGELGGSWPQPYSKLKPPGLLNLELKNKL